MRRDLLLRHDRTVHAKTSKNAQQQQQQASGSLAQSSGTPIAPAPSSSPPAEKSKRLKQEHKRKKNSDLSSLLNQPSPFQVSIQVDSSLPPMANRQSSMPTILNEPLKALTNAAAAAAVKDPQSSYLNVFSIDTAPTPQPHAHQQQHQQPQQQQQRQPPPPNDDDDLKAAMLMTELQHRSQPKKQTANPHVPQLRSSFPFSQLQKYFTDSHGSPDHLKPRFSSPHHPTRLQLNRYLAAYFIYFHPILPFLHPHSFDPATVAPPLLFGVCAIGAQLCHEKNMSVLLHNTSRILISSIFEVSKDFPQNSTPLWAMHTLIMALVYSSWSGDVRGLEFISSIRSTLTTLVKTALSKIGHPQSSAEFIDTELTVRTYFAVFIVFGSLTAIFNYPTQISPADIPANTPLPCSEAFWNSRASTTDHPPRPVLFHDAVAALRTRDGLDRLNLSPMAVRILGIALFKDVWQYQAEPWDGGSRKQDLLDTLTAWEAVAVDSEPGQGQSVSQFLVNSTPVILALAVDNCLDTHPTNRNTKPAVAGTLVSKIQTLQHPLILDAHVLRLVTEIRLMVDMTAIRETVRFHVPHDISSAAASTLSSLMAAGSLSSPALTRLVAKCFDIFQIISVSGMRVFTSVASSPVFVACPEALLSFFETSLLVIMWCHRYEHDVFGGGTSANSSNNNSSTTSSSHHQQPPPEETQLYTLIDQTCTESGFEKSHGRLATTLTLVCADVLEASDSWGFAELMSLAMRAFAYQLGSTAATSTAGSSSSIMSTTTNTANSTITTNSNLTNSHNSGLGVGGVIIKPLSPPAPPPLFADFGVNHHHHNHQQRRRASSSSSMLMMHGLHNPIQSQHQHHSSGGGSGNGGGYVPVSVVRPGAATAAAGPRTSPKSVYL